MSSRALLFFASCSLALFAGCSGDDDGNTGTRDAGPGDNRDAGPRDGGDVTVACNNPALTPPASGTCSHTPGTNGALLIRGDVVAPDALLENAHVLVGADGRVKCAACDCSSDPDYAAAAVLECANGLVSPALINLHEHLDFSEGDGIPHGEERFDHRHDWREGQNGHTNLRTPRRSDEFGEHYAELRQLVGGAVSVIGAGGQAGLMRNLDRATQEGLDQAEVENETFPLGDIGGERRDTGCDYPRINSPDDNQIRNGIAYAPHIAEGIDQSARNEYLCLSRMENGGEDVLFDKTAVIHGVGMNASDYAEMSAEGASLIWSPRTNIDLYGHTAPVVMASNLGVQIGLGTDWPASGSINMLRELACAREFNQRNLGGHFSDREIYNMATSNAAAIVKSSAKIGSLAPGNFADVLILDASTNPGLLAAFEGTPTEVVLVMRGGLAIYGDDNVVSALTDVAQCEQVDVCGVMKRVCAERETGSTLATLRMEIEPITADLFQCGRPGNEPSCIPFRPGEFDGMSTPTDSDGDGIPDDRDNCATVFNPPRAMNLDNGMQPDTDNDMVGDACDVCPLDAMTTTCSRPDPNDRDNDSIPNVQDNCPDVANMDQADRDNDMIGDVCDACPDESNLGGAACSATIYDIQQRNVTMGRVRLSSVLVTAVGPDGYYIQTVDGDESWDATLQERFSGIFVFTSAGGEKPARGDRITLDGEVSEFFGRMNLENGMFTVESSGNTLPAPIMVTSAEVTTGGTRAAELVGVLVRVENVVVTDLEPAPGPGDNAPTGEFEVDGGLRIDDYFFLIDPFPTLNEPIQFIQGPLRFANDNTKIVPRDIVDLGVPPALSRFEPARAYVRSGNTGVPSGGFAVHLTRPAITPVNITLTADMGVTIPTMVTIAADEVSADLTVDAPTASPNPYAVTASYDDGMGVQMINGEILVYDDAAPRLVEDANLEANTIATNAATNGVVTINLPGAVGGTPITFDVAPMGLATVAPVTVAEDAFTATFVVMTNTATGAGTLTVSTGADMETIPFTVQASVARPPVAGDLIITEVHRNPSVNPDEFRHEWFEVFNTTTDMIEIDGITVADNNGMQTISAPGVMIGPNEHAVFARLANMAENGGVTAIASYDNNNIQLANSRDRVVISIGGTELDRVEWDSGMGWPGGSQGRSMCLKFPYGDNSMPANWADSVGTFGTGGDTGHPGVQSDTTNCP